MIAAEFLGVYFNRTSPQKHTFIRGPVSEHKLSSLCETGVPKRAVLARLGWE